MTVRRDWALGWPGLRGFDEITGTPGNDTLFGTDGKDTVSGLGGDDVLYGLDGKDRLDGGDGKDTLAGGKGRDRLVGGSGGDVFLFGNVSDSRPGKADVIAVYKGLDRIDVDAIDADRLKEGDQDFRYVAALTGKAGQLAWSSDGTEGTIIEGDVDGDGIADFRIEIEDDRRDSLAGTDGDDTLIGYDEGETINEGLGEGDDLVFGGGGDDSIKGGFGDNTLHGGDGDDTIEGGGDTITGGNGNDLLSGAPGGGGSPTSPPDDIEGGDGNDTITARNNSTVLGGSGDDSIIAIGASGAPSGLLWGGEGNDTIESTPSGTGSNRFELYGEGGDDSLLSGLASDTLDGGAGNDKLSGGNSNDLLIGGIGNDVLEGGEEDDVLIGGEGADTLDGNEKRDVYKFESVNDSTADNPDLIVKLTNKKTIDLSAIDANTEIGGDQAFMKAPDFTGQAGQLRLRFDSDLNRTFIEGDVDGDGVADFVITTQGDDTTFDSFVL